MMVMIGVFLVSKGADDVMLSSSRLRDGQYERINHFRRVLDNYSSLGLRTLVCKSLSLSLLFSIHFPHSCYFCLNCIDRSLVMDGWMDGGGHKGICLQKGKLLYFYSNSPNDNLNNVHEPLDIR
jgi:hypothetical protein